MYHGVAASVSTRRSGVGPGPTFPSQPGGQATNANARSPTGAPGDAAGTCAHPSAVDCAAINQCLTEAGVCDPATGNCTRCPVGYTVGGGGCQKTYAIDASLLDNLNDTGCGGPRRYNGCSGAFGFHWTDTGDGSVGAVIGADLRIESRYPA